MRRSTPVSLAAILIALVTSLTLAGCGTSGREMREPERDVPSPTRSVPTTTPPISKPPLPLGTAFDGSDGTFPAVPPDVFDISSSAFTPGGDLDATYTCAGPSPALRWQAIPEGTTELALVVTEAADGGDVHWIVTGIAPTTEGVAEGEIPAGAVELPNSLGERGWSAPCPPPGTATSYNVVLLALTQPADVPAGTPATDAYRLLTEQARGNIAVVSTVATR